MRNLTRLVELLVRLHGCDVYSCVHGERYLIALGIEPSAAGWQTLARIAQSIAGCQDAKLESFGTPLWFRICVPATTVRQLAEALA